MIDIKLIRNDIKLVKENIKKKFQNDKLPLVDKVKKLDEDWRKEKAKLDVLRHSRNEISKKINLAKKEKDDKKAKELIKKAQAIPKKIERLDGKVNMLKGKIKEIMYLIPNIVHESVPIGKDCKENVERKKIGKTKKCSYEIFNHALLAERLGGADFDTARKTSGRGFYYLKGKLALLSVAMLNFARDHMTKEGFEYIEPPMMIRREVVKGVMSFEEMEDMMYKIGGEDLYLIGTSEHPLIGMFMDKTLKKKVLPCKITGFSSCFRKEVGAHGLEEKGFFRVHQFNKQEMIIICEPEESYKWYDRLLEYTIEVFKKLDIPVRILEGCSGDLADLKAKSCDVEAWSPRQRKYFEVGSLTNMEGAQARRLNIKINGKEGNYFAHTLNNTVIATPRALIALMENNQQKDGTIKVPKALWKYTGFKEINPIKD